MFVLTREIKTRGVSFCTGSESENQAAVFLFPAKLPSRPARVFLTEGEQNQDDHARLRSFSFA